MPRYTNPNSYLLYAACDFAIAAYFLLGARHLAGICEGDDKSGDQEQEDEEVP